jgi:hypothetical protein
MKAKYQYFPTELQISPLKLTLYDNALQIMINYNVEIQSIPPFLNIWVPLIWMGTDSYRSMGFKDAGTVGLRRLCFDFL